MNSFTSSVGNTNRTREFANETVSQHQETDCGEVNDETTPCGCSHEKYMTNGVKVRTSLIPEQNLKKLKEQFENKTIASVIAKHLRGYFRRRLIEHTILHQ